MDINGNCDVTSGEDCLPSGGSPDSHSGGSPSSHPGAVMGYGNLPSDNTCNCANPQQDQQAGGNNNVVGEDSASQNMEQEKPRTSACGETKTLQGLGGPDTDAGQSVIPDIIVTCYDEDHVTEGHVVEQKLWQKHEEQVGDSSAHVRVEVGKDSQDSSSRDESEVGSSVGTSADTPNDASADTPNDTSAGGSPVEGSVQAADAGCVEWSVQTDGAGCVEGSVQATGAGCVEGSVEAAGADCVDGLSIRKTIMKNLLSCVSKGGHGEGDEEDRAPQDRRQGESIGPALVLPMYGAGLHAKNIKGVFFWCML